VSSQHWQNSFSESHSESDEKSLLNNTSKVTLKLTSHSLTHSLTHSFSSIPWYKVRLQKLAVTQLVKKFLAVFRTRMSITEFTNARHLSLFWARSNQAMTPSNNLKIRLNIKLHLCLGLPSEQIYIYVPKIITIPPMNFAKIIKDSAISFWVPTVQLCVFRSGVCFRPEDGSSMFLRNTDTNTLAYIKLL